MKLEYSFRGKDQLEWLMYNATTSEFIVKRRQRSRMLVIAVYVILSLLMFMQGITAGGIVFAIITVLLYFLYPIIEKPRYRRHYSRYLQANHKEKIGRPITMEIGDEYLVGRSTAIESKVALNEITTFTELKTIIVIKLKSGDAFAVPKDAAGDIPATTALRSLADRLHLPYDVVTDSKW